MHPDSAARTRHKRRLRAHCSQQPPREAPSRACRATRARSEANGRRRSDRGTAYTEPRAPLFRLRNINHQARHSDRWERRTPKEVDVVAFVEPQWAVNPRLSSLLTLSATAVHWNSTLSVKRSALHLAAAGAFLHVQDSLLRHATRLHRRDRLDRRGASQTGRPVKDAMNRRGAVGSPGHGSARAGGRLWLPAPSGGQRDTLDGSSRRRIGHAVCVATLRFGSRAYGGTAVIAGGAPRDRVVGPRRRQRARRAVARR